MSHYYPLSMCGRLLDHIKEIQIEIARQAGLENRSDFLEEELKKVWVEYIYWKERELKIIYEADETTEDRGTGKNHKPVRAKKRRTGSREEED